jgi:ribokinase
MSNPGDQLRAAVVGYASLDYASLTGPFQGAGATTVVRERLSDPWPSLGGISHFVGELRRQQVSCAAVTWLAADELGDRFLRELSRLGADVKGADRTGARSPSCHLYYAADNDPVLFYDSGDCPERLSPDQRSVIAAADWVCLSVASQAAMRQAIETMRADSALLWTVKSDPDSLGADVVGELAERAAVITYSTAERAFLETHCGLVPSSLATDQRLVVETRGSRGVRFWFGDRSATLTTESVMARDSTGAGDTFAAALLAGVMQVGGRSVAGLSHDQVASIVSGAAATATSFLRNRNDRSAT